MNIQLFLSCWKVVYRLFPMLFFISGCIAAGSSQAPVTADKKTTHYQSELADPAAKALFAFSRFRMLGAADRWDEAISALEQAIRFDPRSNYLKLILARAYLHRQQPEQAIDVLNNLLTNDSGNVAAHELLGNVFSYQHDYVAALEQFRQAIRLAPESKTLPLNQAMALARLERRGEAIQVLEELLDRYPDAGFAQLALARLYRQEQQINQALKMYQQLLKQQPEQQQAMLEYGELLKQQDPEAVTELYQSFIEKNPRAAVVRQRLAQFYLARNQLDEALAQFQAIHLQFPDNLQTINRIGLIYLEQENWDAAEKMFRLLVKAEHQSDHNRYYLAMALSGKKEYQEAVTVLKSINSDSPIYTEAGLQLAYLYKQTGQNDQAIAVLRRMMEQGIHQADLYYYLIAFLGDDEKHEEALKFAQTGVAKNPEDSRLLYQLGVLYEKLDQRDAAVQTMEKILQLNDSHPDALNFLAYDQAERGADLPLALSRAQKALAVKPSGYIVDTLGWIYFKMGRYSESREQLEKAIQLHPDDAVIREHLGDLYRAMQLWKKAAEVYQRVLELDPQAAQVEEKLKNMKEEKH